MALIDEGNALEEQGRIADAIARYDAAVQTDPQCARAHLNRGNVLLQRAQIDEARSAYQLAIRCDPHYAGAHFNLGNLCYSAGEFESALLNYQSAIEIRPEFAEAFVATANSLDNLGRCAEASEAYQRALAINPGYAEVHFNLAALASKQRQYEQAAASLRRAVAIKPDFAKAHHMLGTTLNLLGELDAAEASFRLAFSIEPDCSEFLCDLATILMSRGKSPEGLQLVMNAVDRAPNWSTKAAFSNCVARTKFTVDDARVRRALTSAITEPWGMPYEFCWPTLSLLMLDERIAGSVRRANHSWPTRLPKQELFGTDGLAAVAADPLLHALLQATPITTVEFERFLTCARNVLLGIASEDESARPSDLEALRFYAALSRQCFINEYIFDCTDGELAAATVCRNKLLSSLDAHTSVGPFLLLAVAAFFPLYTLMDAARLLTVSVPAPLDEVLRQQIREPFEEQALRSGIDSLTSISRGVSEEVRDQYEQNPYPRWVRLLISDRSLRVNDQLQNMLPLASFTPLPNDEAVDVLIAGCGTGSQSILFTQQFHDVHVLAVDLSLRSIAYAVRKTRELGITNIAYAQADILKLGNIARTFDVIESVGVLHHLADPFAGWGTLLSRLRPGGFMSLGLYSEIARRHVVTAREFISARGYASTPDDIRRLRRDLALRKPSAELQWLNSIPDFYSTSECRDLLLHVQEHRLTLGRIETFLRESGLNFIGFELNPRVLHQYRARFIDDPAGVNLRNWAHFEVDNPDTFVGMYRFWVQLPKS
jgi:tetratricopeptide (TPR) repeat protein/SAM-dependent methyltransferase